MTTGWTRVLDDVEFAVTYETDDVAIIRYRSDVYLEPHSLGFSSDVFVVEIAGTSETIHVPLPEKFRGDGWLLVALRIEKDEIYVAMATTKAISLKG